ncbi:MAG: bifunctional hydroxymethylpyrimidine kinase/phosphomethylpyrimidine kinase [Desulfovibrionaceae bacterium]
MQSTPQALTIAGSDSGGGAGIQADLKTMTMLGVFGTSVVTALTAQNTREVRAIEAPSPGFVSNQLAAVLDDFDIRAAKTGMLYSAPIVAAVADGLADCDFPLVVDPVCVAQSGAKLLDDAALDVLRGRLLPMAALVTPNIPETELLAGMEIRGREDILEALGRILEMGPKAVLIKGGHLDTPALTDWYAEHPDRVLPLMQRRVGRGSLHGTGCTLSAAIAAHLSLGLPMDQAVRASQRFLHLGFRGAANIGKGVGPLNHMARLEQLQAAPAALENLAAFGRLLAALPGFCRLAPEDGAEAAFCLPYADDPSEIVGFQGRMSCSTTGELVVPPRCELGGAPLASVVLAAARRRRPELRWILSLAGDEAVRAALGEAGWSVRMFDWDAAAAESTPNKANVLSLGVSRVLDDQEQGRAPQAVGHGAGVGVAARIYVMAEDANRLAQGVQKTLNVLARTNAGV